MFLLGAAAIDYYSNTEVARMLGGDDFGRYAGYAYDATVTMSSMYAGTIIVSQIPSSLKVSNPGVPFKAGVTGIQLGVNPNTLTPTKNLSTLNYYRIKKAVEYGMDQSIRVGITGRIHDGHHRVFDAIKNGRAVDIIVEPYK